jgi:hypothetical protein
MSFFKDAGDSFLKLSGKLYNKTEGYTKIAKIVIDIKKIESDIKSQKIILADFILSKVDSGEKQIDLENEKVLTSVNLIKSLSEEVSACKKTIEKIKEEGADKA